MSYLQLAQSVDALAISTEALRLAAVDAVARSDEAVTEAQQAATEAAANAASVANLNKVNKQFPFTFATGQAQYDVGVISGDSTITTASMALITVGSLDYAFTINDAKKFTLNAPGSYTNGAAMRIVVNARFDDLIQNFDDLQDVFTAENAANYLAEKGARTGDYYTYLNGLQLEPSVPYIDGAELAILRPTQTVTQSGVLYRPKAEWLPFSTGNWVDDVNKFTPANDMSLREELANAADPAEGAAGVGWDGSTVGAQMDLSKTMQGYTAIRAYSGRATGIRLTNIGIAGFFYRDDNDTTSADNGGTTLVDALGRRWKRQYNGDVFAVGFGLVADGVTDGTSSINKACDLAGVAGTGNVILPAGVILVSNSNVGAASWDNNRAIYLRYDGIKLRGQGRGKTTLKLKDFANAHVIQIGSRDTESVIVKNCGVYDLEIDGNRTNQIPSTDYDGHSAGVNVSTGCNNTTLQNLYVYNTIYYGIGFQRDLFQGCRVINVETNNTGGDGLDWKDDTNGATGNIIDGFKARNFGLSSAVLTPQAGLDLRSGVTATNIDISEMTGVSGLVGIRFQNGTAGATPVQASKVDQFRIAGSNAANSTGLRVISRYSAAANGYVKACSDGYSLTDPDVRFNNLTAENNNVGFRLWKDDPAGVEADTACIVGAIARSNTQAGFVYDSVDEITVLGADVRNNGIGHDIRAGSTNIHIIGGSCSGNTTQISDAGTGTVVTSVSGLRTRQKIKADVLVDSTGTKTVTMTHNLGVTPDITDVQLTFARDPAFNVGDFTLGFYWVDSVSATQVICKARVTAASSTAGAKINLIADINAKSTM